MTFKLNAKYKLILTSQILGEGEGMLVQFVLLNFSFNNFNYYIKLFL